jgi:flagellar biosynthesis protein FliR
VGDALAPFSRFLLAVGLSVILLPNGAQGEGPHPLCLITEFVIGFLLGSPLRFVADVSEMIGEVIDTARGQMISTLLDPLQGHGGSDMAVIAKSGSVVVALMCGAIEVVVEALAQSVEAIPIGSPANDPSLLLGVARSGAFLLGEGMRMCAVWIGAFLLIDIGCSILSRVLRGLAFTQTAALLKMLALFLLLLVLVTEGGHRAGERLPSVVAPWGWGHTGSAIGVGLRGVGGPTGVSGGAR